MIEKVERENKTIIQAIDDIKLYKAIDGLIESIKRISKHVEEERIATIDHNIEMGKDINF